MSKQKKCYYVYGHNRRVTEHYVEIVLTSLKRLGYETCEFSMNNTKDISKDSLIFVLESWNFLIMYLRGYRNIIIWLQGIWPEQSYLRNHSKLRQYLLSLIEKFSIKYSKFCFVVSDTQRRHYEAKYKHSMDNKTYVMPCYNCRMEPKSFLQDGKYSGNVFCYAGGINEWQCFEETMDLYKRIESIIHEASLMVLTPKMDYAKDEIQKRGIKNATVTYVDQSELPKYLGQCKYGFLIRQDLLLNNVATPTKLSTYLSNGMIPVMTSVVKDFTHLLSDKKFVVFSDKETFEEDITKLSNMQIDAKDVYDEYSKIFGTYYCDEYHIENIKEKIKGFIA